MDKEIKFKDILLNRSKDKNILKIGLFSFIVAFAALLISISDGSNNPFLYFLIFYFNTAILLLISYLELSYKGKGD